jgi:hypothetical protein
LNCPDNTGDPAVFRWEENENGEEIRVYVGRKLWRRCFQSSSLSQHRYDPVHNEFDICEFLDPTAQHNSDGEYDDHLAMTDDTSFIDSNAPNPPVKISALSNASTVSTTYSSLPPDNAASAKSFSTSDLSRLSILNWSLAGLANPDALPSFLSWWPSATTWRDCGMNVGYWTSSNEKWFRDRRDKLLRGEEKPRTAFEWWSTMRHHKADMNRIITSARELAASALPQID